MKKSNKLSFEEEIEAAGELRQEKSFWYEQSEFNDTAKRIPQHVTDAFFFSPHNEDQKQSQDIQPDKISSDYVGPVERAMRAYLDSVKFL
jgi:hypothetical protein